MSRIPTHTVDDAPQACRHLLESVIQFSPTGRPLNLHGQMAHSPAVLVAYTSLRAATAEHGTVGPQLSAALMLTAGTAVGNDYVVAITSRLAGRAPVVELPCFAIALAPPVAATRSTALPSKRAHQRTKAATAVIALLVDV